MKRIYVLLIIVFILFGILCMKINNSNKEHEYSLSDIQKILDKTNHITNYECTITCNGEFFEKRSIKDNKMRIKDTDNIEVMVDFVQDKVISMNTTTKMYSQMSAQQNGWETKQLKIKSLANIRSSFRMTRVENESYNKTSCLKITYEDENGGFEPSYIWIDPNNGLILKYIKTYINSHNDIYECNYSFNTVTDKDVNPDLTGYKKINANI